MLGYDSCKTYFGTGKGQNSFVTGHERGREECLAWASYPSSDQARCASGQYNLLRGKGRDNKFTNPKDFRVKYSVCRSSCLIEQGNCRAPR